MFPLSHMLESFVRVGALTVIDADGADAHGFEPVFADGKPIAYVASGGYGHTVKKSIAFPYLPVEFATPGMPLEIGIIGDRRPAAVDEGTHFPPQTHARLG